MRGFVYILCFDHHFWHAKHYVGSTPNLRKRLKQHASGRGAKIIQAISEQGISWRLSQLYVTDSLKEARIIESTLKREANTKRHCPCCLPSLHTPAPPGATEYPIELLPFDTTSQELRSWNTSNTTMLPTVTTRKATETSLPISSPASHTKSDSLTDGTVKPG